MSIIVVRTRVDTAQQGTLMGTRNQHIAHELKGHGIPAVATPNGIGVTEGDLQVHEEDGLRVFTWTPADATQEDVNTEQERIDNEQAGVDEAQENVDENQERLDATHEPREGPSLDELRAAGAKHQQHSKRKKSA